MPDYTTEQRFWNNVDIQGPDDCWPWMGYRYASGYGQFGINYRRRLSHRFAYELTHGAIPDNLQVLHSCDNPPCCNPAHLFLGTQADNIHDMLLKGRSKNYVGTENASSKLTEEKVIEIRHLYAQGNISQYQLGKRFSVAQMTISCVIRRRTWRHVNP